MSFPIETVMLKQRIKRGVNGVGEPIWESTSMPVNGVLVAPGAAADVTDHIRDGVRIDFTLYFPKTFTGSLRGAVVNVRGIECGVIGDPQPYLDPPGAWDRVVPVEVIHG